MAKPTYLYPNCTITLERGSEFVQMNANDIKGYHFVSPRITGVLTNGEGQVAGKAPEGWVPPKFVVGEPFDLHDFVPLVGEAIPTDIDIHEDTGLFWVRFETYDQLEMAGAPLIVPGCD